MLTPRQSLIATKAGPGQWAPLFSADHTDTRPEAAFPLLNTALMQCCTTIESTIIALSGYAGTALIITYHLSSHATSDAHSIFTHSKRAAESLAATNSHTPLPHKEAISAANKILYSNDPLALRLLLIDIIRTANHITES
nr:MAG TPA: hypothetical protein [Caudoviricetes sp.]